MKPHSHDVGVARAFDCFCKKVLRNEARDYQDALARKRNREVYFSELPVEVLEQFAVRDTYFTDSRTFEVIGHSVCIDDETLAEAISALPVDRRDIILLSYFLDMSDAEIANVLNMVRRSVAYRRTSTLGPTQIAKWLKQQQILNPTAYCHAKGLPTSNKPTADPYKWTNETVSRILERVDYLGHTVNFKTTKKSYKSKKKIWNDPENWVIFENTQPPIIEESVFLIVQNIRKARRRPTKMGEMGMFSGLLYCAECGGKMYQCRATNFAENQKYFICSTYRKGKDLCTTHSIKNVVLHEIVLRNLREAISYVSEHEAEFIQDAAESDMRDRDAEFVRKRETLAKADTRIAELDRIISRLYEDNVIGKLSDERFIKMSHDYELEQSNLKSMAEVLRKDLKQQEQQKTNVKAFIAAVKKYTDLQELDAAVLRAFIDRIEVSHVDKKSRTREITIVYNFIGAFDFTRAIENARNTSKKEQRTA